MEKRNEALRFREIMLQKGVSVHDIQLSTGLPTGVITRVIDNGEGVIADINNVLGCLGVSIDDCVNEDYFSSMEKPNTNINIPSLLKQKNLLRFFKPENISLVKSFKGESAKRYVIRLFPLKDKRFDERLNELSEDKVEKLKRTKVIQTNCWETPEQAISEFKEYVSKMGNIAQLYPNFEEITPEEIIFREDELLLEHYGIIFDPFENNRIIKVSKISPKGSIKGYNYEKLKKVYAIMSKSKSNNLRSKIYSEIDLENGIIEEHINLLKLFEVSTNHQGCEIIEFLVPINFDNKTYIIESNNVYNEQLERLKFNVIEKDN